MDSDIGKGLAALGIGIAVTVGLMVTGDPKCLWGFLALMFIYG